LVEHEQAEHANRSRTAELDGLGYERAVLLSQTELLGFLGVAKMDQVNVCGYYLGAPDMLMMLGARSAPPLGSGNLEGPSTHLNLSTASETIQSQYDTYHL
jgi:hypothetical protein